MFKTLFFLFLTIANILFGSFYRLPTAYIFALICLALFVLFGYDNSRTSDKGEEQKEL